jgi:hypothetical protein
MYWWIDVLMEPGEYISIFFIADYACGHGVVVHFFVR